eukprot:GFYU01037312.1.p1 GENE.GFYU01037312.1~~GFYU01037312.1.p1  ORF type:complete len:266 (-),score=19.51 GFYU01037312.1:543-1340(-)
MPRGIIKIRRKTAHLDLLRAVSDLNLDLELQRELDSITINDTEDEMTKRMLIEYLCRWFCDVVTSSRTVHIYDGYHRLYEDLRIPEMQWGSLRERLQDLIQTDAKKRKSIMNEIKYGNPYVGRRVKYISWTVERIYDRGGGLRYVCGMCRLLVGVAWCVLFVIDLLTGRVGSSYRARVHHWYHTQIEMEGNNPLDLDEALITKLSELCQMSRDNNWSVRMKLTDVKVDKPAYGIFFTLILDSVEDGTAIPSNLGAPELTEAMPLT